MERRFAVRLQEMVEAAGVDAGVLDDMLPRLEAFLGPFLGRYATAGQRGHAQEYVRGLISDLESKTAEGIAYLHNCDRQGLQRFIGQNPWDHKPLIAELAGQVAAELGAADAVLVFDPSGFPKQGTKSVGVMRQWCGRLGKVDNCQVGVYLGYVSGHDQTLIDTRLYLPTEWTGDRKRMRAAGVPAGTAFRTRHELALEMLDEHGATLPHGWIAGDDEMGHPADFRGELRSRGERYLLAVPSNTLVRDLDAAPPPYGGHGSQPKMAFVRAARWAAAAPKTAWEGIEVRAGTKGPLIVEGLAVRVQSMKDGSRQGPEELLVVFRERQGDGSWKHDYLLSNAPPDTPLAELARVFNAGHRIEECLKRAKGEAGLAESEARTWVGWHHHQALSLVATWFLTRETRREKKSDAAHDRAATPHADRVPDPRSASRQHRRPRTANRPALDETHRYRRVLSLETA